MEVKVFLGKYSVPNYVYDEKGNRHHVGSLSDLDIQELTLQFEAKIRDKRRIFNYHKG